MASHYDSDEFENMSDDGTSPEKKQNPQNASKPATAAGSGNGGVSPTSMSVFGGSTSPGQQAHPSRERGGAVFDGLEPIVGHHSTMPSGKGIFSSTSVMSPTAAPPAPLISASQTNAGESSSGGGYVAPVPAMDSAEEAIAKVLEGKIWRKVFDPASKKYYYYHRLTQQTTWDLAKELGFGTSTAAKNNSTTAAVGGGGSSSANPNNSATPAATPAATTTNANATQSKSIVSVGGASDASSSMLPPDPLLAKGGSDYRYSGFVMGAGFGGGGGSESTTTINHNNTSFPFGGGGAASVSHRASAASGGFGDYVAFGSPTSTPRGGASSSGGAAVGGGGGGGGATHAVDFPSGSTSNGKTSPNAADPNNATQKPAASTPTAKGLAKQDSMLNFANKMAAVDKTNSGGGGDALPPSIANTQSDPPSQGAHLQATARPTLEAANGNGNGGGGAKGDAVGGDDESSAFSTFSGAAARIAAEAKAKQEAAIEEERKKLAAQREQQAKQAAEVMAKMNALRSPMTPGVGVSTAAVTSPNTAAPQPLTGAAVASPAVGGGLVPATSAGGMLSVMSPLSATAKPLTSAAGGGGIAAGSPMFSTNFASPLVHQHPLGSFAPPALLNATATAAAPLSLQQQVSLAQQQQQAVAAAPPKTELLQTAEALEKLVKAFVTLKHGDEGGNSRGTTPFRKGFGPSFSSSPHPLSVDATDYDTLLRAARYKHVAEHGAARMNERQLLTSHVVPTRGSYLSGTTTTTSPQQPSSSSDPDLMPLAAFQFAQKMAQRASEADNADLLETEILDTVIAMMTADEGRAMWSNAAAAAEGASDAARFQQTIKDSRRSDTNGAALAILPNKQQQPQQQRPEPYIDVVSIDQYRAYTHEGLAAAAANANGGMMMAMKGRATNAAETTSSRGGRQQFLNSIPSSSRFHVNAFDSLTGAFVPGGDTPLAPTTSTDPTPLGNSLEENLEKYLLKHVVPVRGRGMLPPSALLPDGNVMPLLTPHLARMVLLDLLRLSLDILISRFSSTTPSALPINGRDPIIIVYEGPMAKASPTINSSNNNKENFTTAMGSSSSNSFSPSRFLVEVCKRTVQSLPFELIEVNPSIAPLSSSSASSSRPRFRLEHWVTKPHMYSIVHALQWTLRKLERRSNDPYADFFANGGGGSATSSTNRNSNSNSNAPANGVDVAEMDGEWSRVYASEVPFFSLAPPQFLSTTQRAAESMRMSGLNDDGGVNNAKKSDAKDHEEDLANSVAAQTERELLMLLRGQGPSYDKGNSTKRLNSAGMTLPSSSSPSSSSALFARDYFGLDGDHLETMAFAASTIGLDVFRAIAGEKGKQKEKDEGSAASDGVGLAKKEPLGESTAATNINNATATNKDQPQQPEPPTLPLAVKQEIALQCTVACIEELLSDTKILESIKRRATNKAAALIAERDKSWTERYTAGQRALKAGADFVEAEARRKRDEVAAAEKRIGMMVDRMKEEINRQL